MSKEALIAGHERKKVLLGEIIRAGIWRRKPDNLSEEQWSMQRKIGFQYAFTDKTLEELGKQYRELTREYVRQLNHSFLDNINNISPRKLKVQYPRESIPDSKPRTRKSREKMSRSLRGMNWKISEFVLQTGITDPKEIAKRFKIPTRKVNFARRVLKGWEITIPLATARYRDFAEKVKSEKDNQKLQVILDSYTAGSLVGFVNFHRYDKKRILISLSSVLRAGGFYPSVKAIKDFAEKVKTKGIPMRSCDTKRKVKLKYKQILYVVFSRHAKRIIKVLGNDPNLQKFKENPVKQICGPTDIIPTIKALSKKTQYGTVSKLVSETLGFRPSGFSKVRLPDLLEGCPIRVFKYTTKSTWLYPLDKMEELKSFLVKRYQEIQSQAS